MFHKKAEKAKAVQAERNVSCCVIRTPGREGRNCQETGEAKMEVALGGIAPSKTVFASLVRRLDFSLSSTCVFNIEEARPPGKEPGY